MRNTLNTLGLFALLTSAAACNDAPGVPGAPASTDEQALLTTIDREPIMHRVAGRPLDIQADQIAWERRLGQDTAIELPETEPAPVTQIPNGALLTFSAAEWGQTCVEGATAGCLRDKEFGQVFTNGIRLGYAENLFVLSDAAAVQEALPGQGAPGPLTADQVDPDMFQANSLATELSALRLNLAFNRAGQLGSIDYYDLVMVGGPFDQWTIHSVASFAEHYLSGHEYAVEAMGLSVWDLIDELEAINSMGFDGIAADYVRVAAE